MAGWEPFPTRPLTFLENNMGAMKNLFTKIQCGETLTAPERTFLKSTDPKSYKRYCGKVAISTNNPTMQLDLFNQEIVLDEISKQADKEYEQFINEQADMEEIQRAYEGQ